MADPLPIYPADGFVFHHSGGTSLDDLRTTLQQRGLGSQYLMDRDGTIYSYAGQGSPHIQPNDQWGGIAPGLSNKNAIGMEIVARDDSDVTPAQVQAAQDFIAQNYPNTPVYGHGEVNPRHKQASEGMTVVNAIRQQRQAATAAAAGSLFSPQAAEAAEPSGRSSMGWQVVTTTPGGMPLESPTPTTSTTLPQPTLPPTPGGGPIDTDALSRGDFRSVGGIDASEEHGGPGYAPVPVPPNASTATRILAPVQNYVRALRVRGGVSPEAAPYTLPTTLGQATRDVAPPETVTQAVGLPGNMIGAAGDVAGYPGAGTAGKYIFNTVAPLLGGLYGIYQRAAAGEPEALVLWRRAVQGVEDWRAAQAVRAGEMTAARTAQEANAARTAAAEAYQTQTGFRTTPRLLDVPEVNPLASPRPPMETRMLAQTPQPAGPPTFAQWLAAGAGPTVRRLGYGYLGYKLGTRALSEAIRAARPEPGEPG